MGNKASFLGRVGKDYLRQYLAACGDYQSFDADEILKLTLADKKRIASGNRKRAADTARLKELEEWWYESVERGNPDYSVYGDPAYLADVWLCWENYSRLYLKALERGDIFKGEKAPAPFVSPKRVVDLGCGFGYTTAALKEIFPEAEVVGTNLPDTAQYKMAAALGKKVGFSISPAIPAWNADLIFASEYFEHFERPVEHLRDVLKTPPQAFIIANTFGQKSIGHFDSYKDGDETLTGAETSKRFNAELVSAGYRKVETTCWNNRPTFWVKDASEEAPQKSGKGMKTKNFAAFILTHGRPDKVFTVKTLRKCGYTGRVVIVIDNEDKRAAEYQANFPGQVYIFDKRKVAAEIDEADNFGDRRAIIYARNACFQIAKELGIETFIQLDDDYTDFRHKRTDKGQYVGLRLIRNLDAVWDAMVKYYLSIPALSIAMAQGGDFIGGENSKAWMKPSRKCMNSFICSTARPFKFAGRINEDVNTYTSLAARGGLFLTVTAVALQQKQTQANSGGMTELYFDSGTYVKSFYSVMLQPSSVKIGVLRDRLARIHHQVRWRHTTPYILPEHYRKAGTK